jgi:hypothetical protein
MAVELTLVRLEPNEALPAWAVSGEFFSVSRTADELSIVCAESQVPAGPLAERGWRALRVVGKLDFGLTGILASLAVPLAKAGVSIFALSTFDTDYVLVKGASLGAAASALRGAGHEITGLPSGGGS